MSNSKMAVRKKNKDKSFQLDFDFGLANKSKKLLPVVFFGLILSGISFLAIEGNDLWSRLLPVKEVVLKGENRFLKHQDLIGFLQQQPKTGLLAIDLDELQKKAKEIEWVKTVEIRKVWPETLVFIIEEHSPVVVFQNNLLTQFLLTQHGTLIRLLDEDILADKKISELPKISLADSQEKIIDEYRYMWKELKQMKLELELIDLSLNSLNVDEVNNWHLGFSKGFTLNLGRKERLERVERLVKVYDVIENRKDIKNIDLRYHNGFAIEWLETKGLNQQELKQKS